MSTLLVEVARTLPRSLAIALATLCVAWLGMGAWLVAHAPFASGTDESINYVAFAAAENRWATEADFRRDGINFYYYPPLYFLLFAPLPADRATFVDGFPRAAASPPPSLDAGGHRVVADDIEAHVAPALDRLYRFAKGLSLVMGLATALLVGLVAASLADPQRAGLAFALGAGSLLLVPQFLYYSTLVNNDVLVNFWCALGALVFVRHEIALGDGNLTRAHRLLLGLAMCAGLAVLTKTSGVVLLVLLAAGAIREGAAAGAFTNRAALGPWLLRLAALATVFVIAGAWWLVRGVAIGDATGMKAIATAHGWALLPEPFWRTFGVLPFALIVWRTYFGLFNASTWALPDEVALTYVLLSMAWLVAGAVGLRRIPTPAGRWIVASLIVMGVANVALLVAYNHGVRAPYGRLLFPTLAVWHGLFGAGIASTGLVRRPLTALGLLGLGAALMGVAFSTRLVIATVQPIEAIVATSAPGPPAYLAQPAWSTPLVQPVRLAPGRLEAFRLPLVRSGWPMLGGEVRGRMVFSLGDGSVQEHALIAFPYSQNDGYGVTRWVELRLPAPIEVAGDPVVELHVSSTAPWSPPGADARWTLVPVDREGRALDARSPDGMSLGRSLALSLVYAPS